MTSPQLVRLRDKINKSHGDGTAVIGNELRPIRRTTTGILSFDLMLSGGWPLNQWNEIIGNESSGKSALVAHTIATQQAANDSFEVLWIASEDFVEDWMEAIGLDTSRILLVESNVMEVAYQVVIDALDGREVDAIVVDSLPALVASEEDEQAMKEFTVAVGARLTNKFFRKAQKAQKRSMSDEEDRDCLLLIVNQWREKVGVSRGDPRTTPGGKGKNFHYFTRVEVARDEWITVGKARAGQTVKARAIKNKMGPPQRVAVVDFYFDDVDGHERGSFDLGKDYLSVALAYDIIKRAGSKYVFGERSWIGKDALFDAIGEDEKLRYEIGTAVYETLVAPRLVDPDEDPEPRRRRRSS